MLMKKVIIFVLINYITHIKHWSVNIFSVFSIVFKIFFRTLSCINIFESIFSIFFKKNSGFEVFEMQNVSNQFCISVNCILLNSLFNTRICSTSEQPRLMSIVLEVHDMPHFVMDSQKLVLCHACALFYSENLSCKE